jgi:hypothetical protein
LAAREQVLSKLIELMVDAYTTGPRRDQKRARLRIRAELFIKALRKNIAATAQLADAAKWEHLFATECVLLEFITPPYDASLRLTISSGMRPSSI